MKRGLYREESGLRGGQPAVAAAFCHNGRALLAQVPEQAGHDGHGLTGDRGQQMFVRPCWQQAGRNAAPRSWAVPARPRTRRWARCRPGWAGWRVRRRWSRPAMPRPSGPRHRPGPAGWRGAAADLTCTAKAVRVQMGAQDVAGGAPVGADHEAQVAGGGRASGYGAHGIVGIAGLVGQHFQRVPAEQPFGGSDPARPSPDPFRARRRRGRPRWWPARTAAGWVAGAGRRLAGGRARRPLASACARSAGLGSTPPQLPE